MSTSFRKVKGQSPPWSSIHASIVQELKKYVKTLPCLGIPIDNSFKIIQTDASDIGYGGILLQRVNQSSSEQIVCFILVFGTKHNVIPIQLKKRFYYVFQNFRDDILNQKFLVRVECKSAKYVLEKKCQKYSK